MANFKGLFSYKNLKFIQLIQRAFEHFPSGFDISLAVFSVPVFV